MNLLWLRPGIVGGTETAAVGAVSGLVRHAPDEVDLHIYAQPAFATAHRALADSVPTSTCEVPRGSPGPRVLAESTWLPLALRRDRIDVVHWYGGVIPPGVRRPSVLTVHDVQPLEVDAAFSTVKKRWLGRMLPRSVAAAAMLTVPSRFVRDRIVELLGVDPERIAVIPHGLDPTSVVGTLGATTEAITARFRLSGPYVLYPAITYPHKNHRVLIEAFARLGRTGNGPVLVLAGGEGSAENEVAATIERCGVGDRVRRIGRVSNEELAVLMANATVLAFPSRYEGFGLPILEALGVDTPVVVANAGSLPEVAGPAGELVNPDDVEGWTTALRTAVDGGYVDADWTERRRTQLERFDWQHTIPLVVAIYQRVASESGVTPGGIDQARIEHGRIEQGGTTR